MKIITPAAEFCFQDFMVRHEQDFVVFVTGSCDGTARTGRYAYRAFLGLKSTGQEGTLESVSSPEEAMARAAKIACDEIHPQIRRVYVVSAEDLDVPEGEAESHYPEIQALWQMCQERNKELHSVMLPGGEALVEDIVAGRIVQEPDELEDLSLLGGNPLNSLLSDKLSAYQESESLETLAELLSAVYTVAQANGWSRDQLEQAQKG